MSARRTMRGPSGTCSGISSAASTTLSPVELVAPGLDVLRVQREERGDAVVEGAAQAGHDPAVEEDAVGQRVHECDPQPSRPRVPVPAPSIATTADDTEAMSERRARGGTLILGGGFAGSWVARLLGKRGVETTIVCPENFMLFTPLLPEAASGTLEPRHVVVPLRMMCPRSELLLGRATALDVDWTVALFFRRDIAELGTLGHPRRLEQPPDTR